MACTTVASGTRVELAYIEEQTCGIPPAGLTTAVPLAQVDSTGAGAGAADFIILTGSYIDLGYLVGQYINTNTFVAPGNNGNFLITGVTALTLTVSDPNDVTVDVVAGGPGLIKLTLATLRATGRQVDLEKDTLSSEEVRPSRQISDVRHGFKQVTGSPGYELSLFSYDDMIRFAMSGDYTTPVAVTPGNIGISGATPGAGTAQIDRAAGSWADDGFRPGDMINTTVFANAINNRQWRITAVGVLTIDVYDPQDTAITEAAFAGPVVTYPGERIDIGLNLRTMTMEQRFNDIVQRRPFYGVAVNTWEMSVTPEAIVSGTWSLLGMDSDAMSSSSLIGSLVPVPAPTTSPFAAFQGLMFEGGMNTAVVTSFDFTLENNRTLEGVIGSDTSPGVFEGQAVVTGNLTAFLENASLYNKFFNETESSVWMRLAEPSDETSFINFVFPRVKYNAAPIDPPSEGPVPLSMDYQALEAQVAAPGGVTIPSTLTIQKSNLPL